MKTILTLLLSLFTVAAIAQPVAIRRDETRELFRTNAPQFALQVSPAATNTFIPESRVATRMPYPLRTWGSWQDYMGSSGYVTNVTETNMVLQALWMKTNGMWNAGWRTLILEEAWNAGLNSDGTFVISNTFPNGIKALFDTWHSLGFKCGIYTSVSANYAEAITCEGYSGTCYTNLNTHFQEFADWGTDFIFMDNCGGYHHWTEGPSDYEAAAEYDDFALMAERMTLVNRAIEKTHRSMAVLICPQNAGTNETARAFAPSSVAHQSNVGIRAQTGQWDFITGGFSDIVQYHVTNWIAYNRSISQKGTYIYGNVIDPSHQGGEVGKLAVGFNAMEMAFMLFQSSNARRNFWVDPVTYAQSTWGPSANDTRTNILVGLIHQDDACIPGEIVYTNDLAMYWVRHFGGYQTRSNSVLAYNWKSTSQTVPIKHAMLGVPDNVPLTYVDAFFGTNVAVAVTSNLSLTIGSSNVYLLFAYPSGTAKEVVQDVQLESDMMTGTGVSDITATSYGPASWYCRDGMSQSSAANQANIYIPIPKWAETCEYSLKMTTAGSGTIAWTNSPGYEYYTDAGLRVTATTANNPYLTNTTITCTSTTLGTDTNGFILTYFGQTNSPRYLNIGMLASSNSSARYIIGGIRVKFSGWDTGAFPTQ